MLTDKLLINYYFHMLLLQVKMCTPSPRVTRILVLEKPRVMRNPRNAGTWCVV